MVNLLRGFICVGICISALFAVYAASIIVIDVIPTDSDCMYEVSHTWRSGGRTYTVEESIPMSDIEGYENCGIPRCGAECIASNRFVTYKDPSIKTLASSISEQTEGLSDREKANVFLSFVQTYIEYESDTEHHGCEDYLQFPLETLHERKGDCEDVSFLLCSLYKAAGFDSVLSVSNDHMWTGVYCEGEGDSVDHFGREYLVADAASDWAVGKGQTDPLYVISPSMDIAAIAMIFFLMVSGLLLWCSRGTVQ